MLSDNGGEFDAEVQQGFEMDGSFAERIAACAPWQNGSGGGGGGGKICFAKPFEEAQPMNKQEVNELIDHTQPKTLWPISMATLRVSRCLVATFDCLAV